MVTPAFQDLQRAFAAHIRDPATHPLPPGVDARRMRIYHELVHNTVAGLVENAFPVLRSIIGAALWGELCRRFTAQHASSTPLFHEIAREFVDFLEAGENLPDGLPPFALELAHYEWVELALAVDTARPDPAHADPNGDLLAGIPVLSPLAWPLAYHWPVHRLSPRYQPQQPEAQPVYLLAHRNRADRVRFTALNPVAARLLALIDSEAAAGRQQLQRIATELGMSDPAPVLAEGGALLQQWRQADILLGTRYSGGDASNPDASNPDARHSDAGDPEADNHASNGQGESR